MKNRNERHWQEENRETRKKIMREKKVDSIYNIFTFGALISKYDIRFRILCARNC